MGVEQIWTSWDRQVEAEWGGDEKELEKDERQRRKAKG